MSLFKKYRNKETGEVVEVRGFASSFDLKKKIFSPALMVKSKEQRFIETILEKDFDQQFEAIEANNKQ